MEELEAFRSRLESVPAAYAHVHCSHLCQKRFLCGITRSPNTPWIHEQENVGINRGRSSTSPPIPLPLRVEARLHHLPQREFRFRVLTMWTSRPCPSCLPHSTHSTIYLWGWDTEICWVMKRSFKTSLFHDMCWNIWGNWVLIIRKIKGWIILEMGYRNTSFREQSDLTNECVEYIFFSRGWWILLFYLKEYQLHFLWRSNSGACSHWLEWWAESRSLFKLINFIS